MSAETDLVRVQEMLAHHDTVRRELELENIPDPIDVQVLAQGEHNANYWFAHPITGKKYVVRVNYYSMMGFDDQVLYEAEAIRTLAPSGRVATLYHAEADDTWFPRGFSIMEFLEGQRLDYENAAQLAEAAWVLADVHSVEVPRDTRLVEPGNAMQDLYEECRALYDRYLASPLREDRVCRYIDRFVENVQPELEVAPDVAGGRHVLSTELVSAHFLMSVDGRNGKLVDWDKPVVGEVARDVAYFLSPTTTIWDVDFLFTPDQMADFVEQYWQAVDGRFPRASFDARFDAFLRMNCLRGITWSAAAWVDYHDPAHQLKNEKTAKRLEIYLSDEFLDLLARDYFHL